jgi:hypothetical protein
MYTRIFTKILDSSINVQSVPPAARWLWVTMLLIADADRTGIVDMPTERLAARAGLTIEETEAGLAFLSSPDPESHSEDEQGRRIVRISDSTRGWQLVNWDRYRKIAKEEQRRVQNVEAAARYRSRQQASASVIMESAGVIENQPSEADSDSKADSKATTEEKTSPPTSERKKRATSLFEGWEPKETTKAWAAEKYPQINLSDEVEAFRDWHIGKGSTWNDWDKALMSWIRRAKPAAGTNAPFGAPTERWASLDGAASSHRDPYGRKRR